MNNILSVQATSTRLLYSVWMISGLVFSTLLSSIFYSSLAVPTYEPAVNSIADLVDIATTDRKYLVIKDGTSLQADFLASALTKGKSDDRKGQSSVFRQIGQHMLRNGQRMLAETEGFVARVEADRRNVILAMRISLMTHRYLRAKKPLHISTESIKFITTSVALQKQSPLIEPFNLM